MEQMLLLMGTGVLGGILGAVLGIGGGMIPGPAPRFPYDGGK